MGTVDLAVPIFANGSASGSVSPVGSSAAQSSACYRYRPPIRSRLYASHCAGVSRRIDRSCRRTSV
jgi:hypothetical protein